MDKFKRITVNIPKVLLREAIDITGTSPTETILQGLILVKQQGAHSKIKTLKGKLKLEIDIDSSRERTRR